VVEALNGSQEPVRAMLAEYRERRDRLHEWLTADPRIKCHKPGGAFYMFVDVSQAVAAAAMKSTTEFAQALLEESKVAVTPGEAFGAPGFLRISYATSMDNLREGSRRMLEFVRARAGSAAAAVR
jgi:aspartate aminotransferase